MKKPEENNPEHSVTTAEQDENSPDSTQEASIRNIGIATFIIIALIIVAIAKAC